MKKYLLIVITFIFSSISVNAQFADDMEAYTDGEPISGLHWTDLGCGGGIGCSILSASEEAHSGSLSGLIPNDGTTDAILDLGNKIFDQWCIELFMYVPLDKEANWSLKGCVPNCTEDWNIIFQFNKDLNSPGEGNVINSSLGETNFSFPHNEWFRIIMSFDIVNGINLATWEVSIDNEIVIPLGTSFTIEDGTIPISLGGINFFSTGNNNKYFLDDIIFNDTLGCIYINDVDSFNAISFTAIPNPVENIVTLSANEEITSISITNILGQVLFEKKVNTLSFSVDMVNYPKGTYFIKANIGDTISTQKIIK